MEGYVISRAVEQLRHLRLRKPNSILIHSNFDMKFAPFRLIHDDFILLAVNLTRRQQTDILHLLLLTPTCKKRRTS